MAQCGRPRYVCKPRTKPRAAKMYVKSLMWPLWEKVLHTRARTKGLGKMGPCRFEPVPNFFKRVLHDPPNPVDLKLSASLGGVMPPVVGLGDLHGDILALISGLFLLNVINKQGSWIGKNAIVVQCGDLLSRYNRPDAPCDSNVREEVDMIQYMHALNKQARASGGRVLWVLGNHDASRILLGPHRKKYCMHVGNQAQGWSSPGHSYDQVFYPGGWMGLYAARFGALTIRVHNVIFAHGGLTSRLVKKLFKLTRAPKGQFFTKVNARFRAALRNPKTKLPASFETVYFDRTWSEGSPTNKARNQKCIRDLKTMFALLGMPKTSCLVIAHTPQDRGTPVFCKGRVWRIDLRMSEAFVPKPRLGKLIGGIMFLQHKGSPMRVIYTMDSDKPVMIEYVDKRYKAIVQYPRTGIVLAEYGL